MKRMQCIWVHDLTLQPLSAGAADGSLKVWDKRKLTADGGGHALFTFNHHTAAVLRAEWSPSAPGSFHMLQAYSSLMPAMPHAISATRLLAFTVTPPGSAAAIIGVSRQIEHDCNELPL